MKISFSTLACPDWTLPKVLNIATAARYDGVELRFLEDEDSLWKLAAFQGEGLQESRRRIAEAGVTICCVDTSCRFDSPEPGERERWIEEGQRMAELAANLGAPGIRVFGDRIQSGADRPSTREWIIESLAKLSVKVADFGVCVWLETHGDFSRASEVRQILSQCPGVELVWDPAAAFIEHQEMPLEHGMALRNFIRHAHIKDLRKHNGCWSPVLTGTGEFPLLHLRAVLESIHYTGFLSFEWEKKWHPEIQPAEAALPHFADWFRRDWASMQTNESPNRLEVRS